jgi:LPS sulfotransferase NodH
MTAAGPATLPFRRPRRPRFRLGIAKTWLELGRLRHQLKLSRHWWLYPHRPYQPFFVLATHRSGSNLLIDFVNRLSGVQSHSEILCPTLPIGPRQWGMSPEKALAHIRRSLQMLRPPVRGCKLMLDQLANCQLTLADLNLEFPGAKFIVLYRQSLAEQFLSRESAKATDQWCLREGQVRKQARVIIKPAELRTYCDRIRRAYREVLDHPWLSERGVLLSYEELTADPQYWLDQHICPLLGVLAGRAETCLRKQNTLPLAERVENYREVAALLASPLCQQRYAWPSQQRMRRAA